MYDLIILIFLFGYVAIVFENNIKVDKAAIAMFIGVLCWTALIMGRESMFPSLDAIESAHYIEKSLMGHLSEIAGVLFFLLGAMTTIELIDSHEGFSVITDKIKTLNRVRLLWIISVITFFLSAALDNLTTAIVMAALVSRLMKEKKDIWMFAGMIVIAANAGGAWSPIGDVTTIMLWIDGQVTAGHIIHTLFIPCVFVLLVPLSIMSFRMKGDVERPSVDSASEIEEQKLKSWEKNLVLILGICALLFVPVFKSLTHLPPFMGMLIGLSVLWSVTDIMHYKKSSEHKTPLSIVGELRKVDTPSILYFLGILMAVAALQTAGHLASLSNFLSDHVSSIYAMNSLIGMLSSVIDNASLVAGVIGMYPLDMYPVNHSFWELLALCAGTGGSMLIIGSAAGVAMMGILKVDFKWYLRNISIFALLGYAAGIACYYIIY